MLNARGGEQCNNIKSKNYGKSDNTNKDGQKTLSLYNNN
jgi:hypothetical protein